MHTSLDILKKYWGYSSFKPLQGEIIDSVIEGEDTFALLPTGGGKSICYQIPVMMKKGIGVVISPLIALMQDQVHHLQKKGIKAIALTSGIKYAELDTLLDNCIYGNYKFLYLSPERLQQDIVQERLKQMSINLIAVDEAHCISQWGSDFRPSYKKISVLRELFPSIPMIALTASATKIVVADIINELELFQPKIFKQSFYRSNLAYRVIHAGDKHHNILQILEKHPGSSIIYTRNRKTTIELDDFLNDHGHRTTYYHGGVDAKEKTKRFKQWITNDIRIMVATNAFGMGVDKPDVRTVIHYDIPESIESYFQEAGRAGRDGKLSHAFLLKNQNDHQRLHNQFIKVLPNIEAVKTIYRKLCNYFQISYGEGEHTTHEFDFNSFCKTYGFGTLLTYNTLQFLDRCEVIRFTQRFSQKNHLQIIISGSQVLRFIANNSTYELIIKTILRSYSNIFDEKVAINIPDLASKTDIDEKAIIAILNTLQEQKILEFSHQLSDAVLIFLVPREDERTINKIKPILIEQNESKIKKVQSILKFSRDHTKCKSRQLLHYFGEKDTFDCEICSFCIDAKNLNINNISQKQVETDIIKLLTERKMSSRDLTKQLHYPEKLVLQVLRKMNELRIIKINHDNNYQIG
ncbi:RecQ family ATP-dependent DNA helicase [Aquimarina sp. U1-2]|uniref:RecQ family ATP-dependent DNA helicase n=1 Tax=Aquimarina sp. U1-2 TaxID=2823141 RepID=UPI001AECF2C8|nr:ATP-dependent DNA helicase RecQ [Aquimarina sp. U1-2]MBP2832074.1 RecQ family ATP-dependent DNA helicase [Aquimarina sp. U1-2]